MLSNHKGGYTIELNDAVWMMEAVFNYYHGFTGESYLVTTTDSTFIPVAYSGFNDVPIDELQQLFVQANNAIVASFEAYPGQNKKPYIFDLELQATTEGTQLLVMTTTGIVDNKKSSEQINDEAFGDTDYWYPTFDDYSTAYTGKCGPYAGQQVGVSAADKELEKSARRYLRGSVYIVSTYWVDIEWKSEISYFQYSDNLNMNPYGEFLLWEGEFEDCLNPDMMNTYFDCLAYIIEDKKPIGKTFVNCNIQAIVIPDIKEGSFSHLITNLRYGVKKNRGHWPMLPQAIY